MLQGRLAGHGDLPTMGCLGRQTRWLEVRCAYTTMLLS